MSKSSTTAGILKPAKPYDGFPLWPHNNGRWAKKIRGKFAYFGKWTEAADGNWEAALELYQKQRDDLHAGYAPRPAGDTALTLKKLVNVFLMSKEQLIESGELSPRTFFDYRTTGQRLVDSLGTGRTVESLRPADFTRLRAELAKGRGAIWLGNEIQRIRSIFKYAGDADLIEKPVKFGPDFKKPSRKTKRLAKAASKAANGKRMFDAAELRSILAAAKPAMKAMILLGVNCGFGQSDIAHLPISCIDLDRGWIDFPRPKTGIERRCPLWPETIEALRVAIGGRPEAKRPEADGMAFVTKYGGLWVKVSDSGVPIDAVGAEFIKLLVAIDAAAQAEKDGTSAPAKLRKAKRSFYALRHVFETIGGGSRDQVAVDSIMGHVDTSMGGEYREGIEEDRLRAVVAVVRKWLFGD